MSIHIRPGNLQDSFAAYLVQHHAVTNLVIRLGYTGADDVPSQDEIEHGFERIRSLYEHLARTAESYWVAEQGDKIVGYSRAVNNDGVRQLTEFFVLPEVQGQGVGRELLARAFPSGSARQRLVIASPSVGAQTLYMRSGVYARHVIYGLASVPQPTSLATELGIEPMQDSGSALRAIAEVDAAILGFQRDADHTWLLSERQGWLYRRQGRIVGYGYTGVSTGPFALLEPAHYPAVLAHAESQAAAAGHEQLSFWVHSPNQPALDYLLARKYSVRPFVATLLSDAPFGRFDSYVNMQPPFLL